MPIKTSENIKNSIKAKIDYYVGLLTGYNKSMWKKEKLEEAISDYFKLKIESKNLDFQVKDNNDKIKEFESKINEFIAGLKEKDAIEDRLKAKEKEFENSKIKELSFKIDVVRIRLEEEIKKEFETLIDSCDLIKDLMRKIYENEVKTLKFEEEKKYMLEEITPITQEVLGVSFNGVCPFIEMVNYSDYSNVKVLEAKYNAYKNISDHAITSSTKEDKNYTKLTLEKYVDLYLELKLYKEVARQKNQTDIKTAREFGDLSENAEYQIAREQQGLIEARISELEKIVDNCEIIEPKTSYDIGEPGATVTIQNLKTKATREFMLVGATESDINCVPQKISNVAPIGKAVVGKKAGDTVAVIIGKNKDMYKIISIK